jgi:HK97 family phage prohead protease
MILERRTFLEPVEFRAVGKTLTATGVAIRYNSTSKDLGGWYERALPSCAVKTVNERDIVALRDHDPSQLLGRVSSGTLRLDNGPDALRYEIDLPDTTAGRDTATLLERRDIVGSSFGFSNIVAPTWEKTDDGRALRSLVEIAIRDVGPVTFPAYEESSAEMALRSLADERGLELRSVMTAASAGRLATLLDREPTKRKLVAPGWSKRDTDENPVAVLQGIDAALDEATDLLATVDPSTLPAEVAQGIALVTVAEQSVDNLLDMLGIFDADDDDVEDPADPADGSRDQPTANRPRISWMTA